MTLTMLAGGVAQAPTATAAAITNASISGGTGTASVQGMLYAKQDAGLRITVTTDNDVRCVSVAGAANLGTQKSSVAKTSWVFDTTASAGDGVQGFTISAIKNLNPQGDCTGQTATSQVAYTADNSGPDVDSAQSPSVNGAGWNRDDVTVTWTATDALSGVAGPQPFKSEIVTIEGTSTVTALAVDRLGNPSALASRTIRLDKTPPTIVATETKNSDGTRTVTFTCSDPGSAASGIASCLAQGSTTNGVTVAGDTTVTGTAVDTAGNTASASFTTSPSDITPPTLAGTPTTSPNDNGWYNGDVTVAWTCSDEAGGSGIDGDCPADDVLSGDGKDQTVTRSVRDIAGNTTEATSSPPVSIDRTAPTTGISGVTNQWVNDEVTVALTPADNLSGVATTTYTVNGGAPQTGTALSLSSQGEYTVTYFSTDLAGNVETPRTAVVKIDKTAPTITTAFTPSDYTEGTWAKEDVTVTFTCDDQGGSGLLSCSVPVTKATEGAAQLVEGTATDNAGNSSSTAAAVSIDKTPPIISATVDGEANDDGWYRDDVTVRFSANDALSGIADVDDAVVLGEGSSQSAGGSATDRAGNVSTAGVSGINIDKTAPVLTGSYPKGWQTNDVTVTWTCTDEGGSGVKGSQPADTVVTGEGANLTATASCVDVAGNEATTTVSGIQIDRTAPVTDGKLSGTAKNGWYRTAVDVTLSASDSLSGVAATHYVLDGGDPQLYEGSFSVETDGAHVLSFWSTDVAGNLEEAGAPLTFRIDRTAPVTTVIDLIPDGGDRWFTSGVPVAFLASDDGSGVAGTYYRINDGEAQVYGEPFTADLPTGTHTIAFWSVDLAGNTEALAEHNVVNVPVDTTFPTISGTRSPGANSWGWNNGDVEVTFACDDEGSGVAGCEPDVTLTNETTKEGTSITGSATDVAGNTTVSSAIGPIRIDTTKPTLTGAPTEQANAAGWYNEDVTIAWTGSDALSGIDPDTQPGENNITGEGRNLGAGPRTISDKAGNVSDAVSVNGINIDRTSPVLTGAAETQPNDKGWYNDSVTVRFTCADPALEDGSEGSGVAECPTNAVIDTDGANQTVTSGTASDRAGNTTPGIPVGPVSIDGTAPSTTSDNLCTTVNDWCTGDDALVQLKATDQDGLSGVREIRYVVNGGEEKVIIGASGTVTVPLSGSGNATVQYWAIDNADNVEEGRSVSLKWDNIAPTLTHDLSPAANAAGWNNSDVVVTFSAVDDDHGSGVEPGSLTEPVTVDGETDGLVVPGSARDLAGNVGNGSATVKLDRTKPTIEASVSGPTGANGWYTGPVTVSFTCDDALSGVATCPQPYTFTADGAGQQVTESVTDVAGNTASVTVEGIDIDSSKPLITIGEVESTYLLGQDPMLSCTATDATSGVANGCTVTTTGGNANGVGTFTYTARATDSAGNVSTASGTYRVIYRFDGFLQPINNTAHQVGVSTSIFKAGSTVPAKFQLKRVDGTVVQGGVASWLTPAKGSAMAMAVDETVYTATPDSGSTYKYDATARQYHYNWKTGSASGNYWRIGVTLDDGQTYYVNIGLR